MRTHDYFHTSRGWHPEVTQEIAEHCAKHYEHEVVQEDGRIRRWGYSRELGKYVRVILLEDGKTLFNAFIDRDYERKYKPGS